MMRIFISGFGTVGQGFLETLVIKSQQLASRYSEGICIVGICDSKSYIVDDIGICGLTALASKSGTGRCGKDLKNGRTTIDIMETVDFDTLVEATPTNLVDGGEGYRNIKWALEHGIDVITVNKGPLALKFAELKAIADANGCMLRFEGSVGGAMPIINLCGSDLGGQRIKSIQGILNGTCNFILSRMDSGLPFDQALKEAQQLGYAETDPTNDVEGFDSASKAVILANAVFGRDVTIEDVDIVGITSITSEAVSMASENGMVIRLIVEVSPDKLEVAPRLVPKGHALSITGTKNKAVINTDLAGPVSVSGRGAGRMETASAILSDMLAIMDSRAS